MAKEKWACNEIESGSDDYDERQSAGVDDTQRQGESRPVARITQQLPRTNWYNEEDDDDDNDESAMFHLGFITSTTVG